MKVPLREVYSSRGGETRYTAFVLVRVETPRGEVGYGEASIEDGWMEGETQGSVKFAIENNFREALIEEPFTGFEGLHDLLDRRQSGNLYAKSAIDMAMYDLVGRLLDVPVYMLLGGRSRDRIPVKFNIPISENERAAKLAKNAIREGYGMVKLKVGRNSAEDLSRLEAVRSEVGDKAEIGIDSNGAWTVKQAIATIRAAEKFDLYFAEQPVPRWNVDGLAEVRKAVSTRVMADESVETCQDAMNLIRHDAVDLFSIYLGKPGGLYPALKLAAIAETAAIGCTLGSAFELGIANAAKLHLAASSKIINVPSDFPVWYYAEDVISPKLEVSRGQIGVPNSSGLGVKVDERKLRRFAVDLK